MTYEDAEEIRQSHMWSKVCEEIDKRIADLHSTLLTIPPDKLVGVQQKLQNLAEFKSLPDDVMTREGK